MTGREGYEEKIKAAAEAVDRLLTVDLAARGLIEILYAAARRVQKDEPLCFLAAKKLLQTVKKGDKVVIATGLPIRGWFSPSLAENDGPAGAASLARAIYTGLGAIPVLLGEEAMVPLLQKAGRAAGMVITNWKEWDRARNAPGAVPGRHIPVAIVEGFPSDLNEAKKKAGDILRVWQPKVLLAIERQGANQKGVYHYGKGEANADAAMAKIDVLMEQGKEKGILTIGIGDGGNELGLGLIREEIRSAVPFGALCTCPCQGGIAPEFAADVVVTAAASNWGAWGIEACLALLTGRREVLHTPERERNILRVCADAGAMDGITGFVEPDVDGIPGEICVQMVAMLNFLVSAALPAETAKRDSGNEA